MRYSDKKFSDRKINHFNQWLDDVLIGTDIPYDAIVEIKDLFIKISETYYNNLTVCYSFPNYYFILSKMLIFQQYLDEFPDYIKLKLNTNSKKNYKSWTLILNNMDPDFFRKKFINENKTECLE